MRQWYVVHTYSGFEHKVKAVLEERVRAGLARLPGEIASLEGKSNKEAAHMLARSVRTVEVHRGRIMKKLGVDNLVDLVKAAYATGLAEPPS